MYKSLFVTLVLVLGQHSTPCDSAIFFRSPLNHRTEAMPLDWGAAHAKASRFVDQLTLEEKLHMVRGNTSTRGPGCTGNIEPIPRLSFPGICFLDGPNGVNRNELVSVFPAGVTTAATWDKHLMYKRGLAMGSEFKGKGGHVFLGPNAGPIGRHPAGGRNWETFSPDPYLTGVAMEATIRGVQANGVQTASKHYIGNEQETQRSNTTLANGTHINAISSNIDDRTMHELYLWPFSNAVRAGTSSVMCSYQRLNQTYACENPALLNSILKAELGFQGYVVSDWLATHSTAPSANSGLDLEMPGFLPIPIAGAVQFFGSQLAQAVRDNSVPLSRLDDMVRRIMTPYFLLGQDSPRYPTPDPSIPFVLAVSQFGLPTARAWFENLLGIPWTEPRPRDVRADHASLIRRIGAEGTVLLKNVNTTLPLSKVTNIGVFGSAAGDLVGGLQYPDEGNPSLGPVVIGGGSGSGRLSYIVSPLAAIKTQAQRTGARVQYVTDDKIILSSKLAIYPTPEVCLVFLAAFARESRDRNGLEADRNSTAVVRTIAETCPSTIVFVHGPGVVTMPWADHPNVKAILAGHYPGQEIGNSVVDVLWGSTEPSGRLPYSIPMFENQTNLPIVTEPSGPGENDWQADFTEGQLIDYRAFDAHKVKPRYEFGFGLSYTTFNISSIKVTAKVTNPAPLPDPRRAVQPGGNPTLWTELVSVKAKIRNTGRSAGSVVPQLYLTFPSTTPEGTPPKVLRGFEKLYLRAGASSEVEFGLMRRDVSYWDVARKNWVIPRGEFLISVGYSSRDMAVSAKMRVLT